MSYLESLTRRRVGCGQPRLEVEQPSFTPSPHLVVRDGGSTSDTWAGVATSRSIHRSSLK